LKSSIEQVVCFGAWGGAYLVQVAVVSLKADAYGGALDADDAGADVPNGLAGSASAIYRQNSVAGLFKNAKLIWPKSIVVEDIYQNSAVSICRAAFHTGLHVNSHIR
jgi:hypothetical protein